MVGSLVIDGSQGEGGGANPPQGTRVFLGVKIAPDIADQLLRQAEELREEHVKIVASADVHLTLVPPWQQPSISGAIEKFAWSSPSSTHSCSSFSISIMAPC